jgi:hypothetical protein
MGQDTSDVHYLPAVFDGSDEAEIVAADIEYGEDTDGIRVREVLSRFHQVPPSGAFRCSIPVHKRFPSFRMLLAKFVDRSLADNLQTSGYRNGNRRSRGGLLRLRQVIISPC